MELQILLFTIFCSLGGTTQDFHFALFEITTVLVVEFVGFLKEFRGFINQLRNNQQTRGQNSCCLHSYTFDQKTVLVFQHFFLQMDVKFEFFDLNYI